MSYITALARRAFMSSRHVAQRVKHLRRPCGGDPVAVPSPVLEPSPEPAVPTSPVPEPSPEPAVRTSPVSGAYDRACASLSKANVFSEPMLTILRQLTLTEREQVARETGTMVVYFGEEVGRVRKAEEDAALRAAPPGHPLEQLNGLNVGCGDRIVQPSLVGLDAHRGTWLVGGDSHQTYNSSAALLAWAHELPFACNSMDYIVAMHILEHMPDPVATVLHWLSIVKPGGGVGIIVPDWRYTWDARDDDSLWGHRMNPTPELLRELYEKHWKPICTLEHCESYPFKLSFDVVLRKHGTFVPFGATMPQAPTGKALAAARSRLD